MISKTRSKLYNTLTAGQVSGLGNMGKAYTSAIHRSQPIKQRFALTLPQIGTMTGKDISRVAKFCLVGLSGVGVATASLWLARDVLGLALIVSGIIAHLTSVTNNFIWNQLWTFGDRREKMSLATILARWLKYLLSTLAAAGIYLGVLKLLTDVLGIHHLLSSLCGIAAATPVNFLASNLWVWKASPRESIADRE